MKPMRLEPVTERTAQPGVWVTEMKPSHQGRYILASDHERVLRDLCAKIGVDADSRLFRPGKVEFDPAAEIEKKAEEIKSSTLHYAARAAKAEMDSEMLGRTLDAAERRSEARRDDAVKANEEIDHLRSLIQRAYKTIVAMSAGLWKPETYELVLELHRAFAPPSVARPPDPSKESGSTSQAQEDGSGAPGLVDEHRFPNPVPTWPDGRAKHFLDELLHLLRLQRSDFYAAALLNRACSEVDVLRLANRHLEMELAREKADR